MNATPTPASPLAPRSAPLRKVIERRPVEGSRSLAHDRLICGHVVVVQRHSRQLPYWHCRDCFVEALTAAPPANDVRPGDEYRCGGCGGTGTTYEVDAQGTTSGPCEDCSGTGSRLFARAHELRTEWREAASLANRALDRGDIAWAGILTRRAHRLGRALGRVLRISRRGQP